MATLTVKNVGPIREAEFEVKKYTVFIGPQGSGKSTLAKLIAIGGDVDAFKVEIESQLWAKYSLDEWITPLSTFMYSDSNYDLSFSENFKVKVALQMSETYQLLRDRWQSAQKKVSLKNSASLINGNINELYQELEDSEAQMADFLNTLIPASSTYIPAERTLISILSENVWALNAQKVNIPALITSFGRRFENARYKIKELLIPFLGVSYQNKGGVNQLQYKGSDTILLSQSASGFQSIIPLMLTVEYLRQFVIRRFIIEEPELNLYPTAQKDLIYNLVSGLDPEKTYQDAEWVFTTHSPYVLSSFNTLMLAYKVGHQSDENRAKVEAIIPSRHWINPDDFAAYYVNGGTVESIVSEDTGLLDASRLDDVSDDFADEQEVLFTLYRNALKVRA